MRVGYAFQLFSAEVEKGLYLYKRKIENQYGNSEPTVKFVSMMKNLISIMIARKAENSLRLKSNKHEMLLNFLTYLNECKNASGTKGFLTQNTATGLRVTIKSTLDLLEFLTDSVGFKYLMTSRLSQDTIENIFGIIRQS